MMKMIAILSTTTLMVGCSGLNSEFEHSIPAKDSGYWLQQADDMTSTRKDGLVNPQVGSSSYVNVKEYKLINTGNLRLPVKMQGEAEVAQGNVAEINQTSSYNSTIRYEEYDNNCAARFCYPEPSSPFRELDRISRVWLAPYLSPDNNVHLGEIVYFIAKPSTWSGIEPDGGK